MSVVAVSFAATVSSPSAEMLVPLFVLPVTLHVTVCAAPPSVTTSTANCCVSAFFTVAVWGETVTERTAGVTGSSVTSTVASSHLVSSSV